MNWPDCKIDFTAWLHSLLDGENWTMDNGHMWCTSYGEQAVTLSVRLMSPVPITGLHIWNYNGSSELSSCGVSNLYWIVPEAEKNGQTFAERDFLIISTSKKSVFTKENHDLRNNVKKQIRVKLEKIKIRNCLRYRYELWVSALMVRCWVQLSRCGEHQAISTTILCNFYASRKKTPQAVASLHEFHSKVQWAAKVMTLASIRNTRKQGSWLLWPTVQTLLATRCWNATTMLT